MANFEWKSDGAAVDGKEMLHNPTVRAIINYLKAT